MAPGLAPTTSERPEFTGDLYEQVGRLAARMDRAESDFEACQASLTDSASRPRLSPIGIAWAEKHAAKEAGIVRMVIELRHAAVLSCATGIVGVTIGAALLPLVSKLLGHV